MQTLDGVLSVASGPSCCRHAMGAGSDLAARIHISESPVRYRPQQVYLPFLPCHERQHRDRLAQAARQHGGFIIALDGLAPPAGEPPIWLIRELSSGLT